MLLGRMAETERIEQLIRSTKDGRGGTLLVRGEPGIGKTALLRHARSLATGMRVLFAAGAEAEAELAFASLASLLGPILEHRDALPGPQRAALEGALLLGPPVPADRFAVQLASFGLLCAAASLPMAILVDDAHCMDAASRDALFFCVRRLHDLPVASIITARTGPEIPDARGMPELVLTGLDVAAARALLGSLAKCEVATSVATELREATAGNALALVELARSLDASALRGEEPLPDPLPLARDLELAFGERIRGHARETRQALLIAAASETGDVPTLARALAARGLALQHLAPAEAEGLLDTQEGRVRFHHPLVRAAAYRTADVVERREAHRALAEALAADLERRALHLAAAVAGPDDGVADELEDAARNALGRGSLPAAASRLERAARLTTFEDRRHARLLEAAGLWERAGMTARALALVDEIGVSTDVKLRAGGDLVRGRVAMWSGDPMRSRDLLLGGARAMEESAPGEASAMLVDASVACTMVGDCERALEIARRAQALATQLGGPATLGPDLAAAQALILTGRTAEGLELARGVVVRASDVPPHVSAQILAQLPILLGFSEDHAGARDLASRAISLARAQSMLTLLPYLLVSLSLDEAVQGELHRAYANAVEGLELSRDLGLKSELAFSLYATVRIEALLGLEAQARVHASEALDVAKRMGIGSLVTMTYAALGALEVGVQRFHDALGPLELAAQRLREQHMRQPIVVPCHAELVEALVQLGRADEAEPTLDDLSAAVARAGSRWGRAVEERCRALIASNARDALHHFEDALLLHEASPTPIDRGRTELRFGQFLHRQRRTEEARRHLRRALELFDLCGAQLWCGQVRHALAVAGERVTADRPPQLAVLTPQEIRVCLAVASGATNREISSSLFVTTKTVETHLTNVYRKLGIRSRTELVRLLAAADRASLPTPSSP